MISKGGVLSQAIGGFVLKQHAKKVVSDDLDLVGFAIGQVKFSGGGGGTAIYGLYRYVLL